VQPGLIFRVGGLVQQGSVKRDQGLEVHFVVTDGKNSIPVNFSGVLPDLFREGQGVVALGTQSRDGVFLASEVLAKHDEKYMPPEVVDALKRAGRWQEGGTGPS
jgi:cytochrome c-type biogenesis protein CcmE